MSTAAPILLTTDDNYVRPAAACIASICLKTPDPYVIVISQGLSARCRRVLTEVGKAFSIPLEIRDADAVSSDLPTFRHFSEAIYTRLKIPEICPEAKRAVYVDADAIAVHSLQPLQTRQCRGPVAAVRDPFLSTFGNRWKSKWFVPNHSPESPYVNSGVMVMDLEQWREDQLGRRCVEFIINNRDNDDVIKYPDQDAINAVIDGIELLDPLWNVPPVSDLQYTKSRPMPPPSPYGLELEKQAFITHFLGSGKPWHADFPRSVNWARFHELGAVGLEIADRVLPATPELNMPRNSILPAS